MLVSIILFFFTSSINCFGQVLTHNNLKIGFFNELYYSYDSDKPQNHEKFGLISNYKKHNEINTNLLLLNFEYDDSNFVARGGIMTGNYPYYNLANQPDLLRIIYEANILYRLSKRRDIGLQVGIMPSHIGFESVIAHDNFTLSRSLMAENSPYYETGVKFYGSNKLKNLFIAGLLLNGWQTIAMPYGIQSPSLGFQITLKESHNIELNYSNFWGYIFRDSLLRRRVYHNFYSRYSIKSFDLLAGFDYGIDLTNHQIPQNWWTFGFLVRKKILIRNAVALRLEYFNDHHKVIESNPLLVPFKS